MKLTHEQIEGRLRAHEVRLGIGVAGKPAIKPCPTMTVVIVPVVRTSLERLHVLADLRMAADPAHDAMYERLDAELREIVGGRVGLASPRMGRPESSHRERLLSTE